MLLKTLRPPTDNSEAAFLGGNVPVSFKSAPLLNTPFHLFLSKLREEWDCREEEKRDAHHPSPWGRQRPRKPLSRKTDWRRWIAREKETGGREREGIRETVSQKVIKKQVEEEGRMADPRSQRRLMDKRACESMLGGWTHCQTHRHQTHEEKEEEEDESESVLMGGEEFIESTFGRVPQL